MTIEGTDRGEVESGMPAILWLLLGLLMLTSSVCVTLVLSAVVILAWYVLATGVMQPLVDQGVVDAWMGWGTAVQLVLLFSLVVGVAMFLREKVQERLIDLEPLDEEDGDRGRAIRSET